MKTIIFNVHPSFQNPYYMDSYYILDIKKDYENCTKVSLTIF